MGKLTQLTMNARQDEVVKDYKDRLVGILSAVSSFITASHYCPTLQRWALKSSAKLQLIPSSLPSLYNRIFGQDLTLKLFDNDGRPLNSRTVSPGDETKFNKIVGKIVQAKYEIKRLLGRGTFGEVWKAIHLATNEPVAIKRISGIFSPKGLIDYRPEVVYREIEILKN